MLDRRTMIASGVLAPALLTSSLWSQNADELDRLFKDTPLVVPASDFDRIRRRAASFFEKVVALSVESPPPGLNASNGWFVNAMKSNGDLAVAQRPISTDSPAGALCAEMTLLTIKACRDGFEPGLHGSTGVTNLGLATDVFNAALPSILEISAKIVAAVYTGGAVGGAISADVTRQVAGLGEAVKNRGIVGSGEHANGWISHAARDRANEVIARIDKTKTSFNADGRDYLEILKVLLAQITALPTEGHSPWLRAEWQLGFTAIAATGGKVMRNPPE